MPRQTYVAKPGEVKPLWRIVDATDVPLGRLASDVAIVLMGKHRPEYTPHVECGDFVVVTNATKVALTGKKAEQRLKQHWTGYPSGLRAESYGAVRERDPEKLVQDAVRRMLPKNRLSRLMLKRLKVYGGADHPHADQQPITMKV